MLYSFQRQFDGLRRNPQPTGPQDATLNRLQPRATLDEKDRGGIQSSPKSLWRKAEQKPEQQKRRYQLLYSVNLIVDTMTA